MRPASGLDTDDARPPGFRSDSRDACERPPTVSITASAAPLSPETSVIGAIVLIHRLHGKFAVPALPVTLSALKLATRSAVI